jgi:predicted ferric reductase
MMWKWPKEAVIFEKVDSRLVHCRFAKSSLSSLLGNRDDVGQYIFINFPQLSLQEWHPFSVASGPSDPHIDVYIKALGNHTKKIVEYAERCASENKQVKIRTDGPYGRLPFNYLRYGSIVFVAGGIGITPALSILNNIYQKRTDATKQRPAHCTRDVTIVWVVPYASEALFLLDQLESFHRNSRNDTLLPDLKVSIHVTRSSDGREMMKGQRFIYSRPEFNDVIDECLPSQTEDGTRSTLVYACGPAKMVKQCWDAAVKRNTKAARVDFYHETFEF